MHTRHHAAVFEGDMEPALEAAKTYVEEVLGITLTQNPDVSLLVFERVTIENARALKEEAAQHPLGHARVFIISCDTILVEAQNALLKLFEEPAERTHFVLVLPTIETLLSTVRSRLFYMGRYVAAGEVCGEAKKFLNASYPERMKMIDRLTKDKDRVETRTLITGLLALVHKDNVLNNIEMLKDIAIAADYIQDRSSSVKHILHHLAVSL